MGVVLAAGNQSGGAHHWAGWDALVFSQVLVLGEGLLAPWFLPQVGFLEALLQESEARFLFCGPRPHSLSQTHPGPSPGELCVASALVLRTISLSEVSGSSSSSDSSCCPWTLLSSGWLSPPGLGG